MHLLLGRILFEELGCFSRRTTQETAKNPGPPGVVLKDDMADRVRWSAGDVVQQIAMSISMSPNS
jgi:hypothetical protein